VRALAFDRFGGPEVLAIRELPDPVLAPGTALVRTKAIGLNFADVYRRRGNYHLVGTPPWILGYEGAGIVEAVDAHAVSTFAVGDRVAFADVPHANAEIVRAPLDHLVPLPAGIDFDTGAGALLQGLTAQYLVTDSHAIQPGERAVVHAAAGGVGLLLVQMIARRGGRAIALTSSADKAELARSAGAFETHLYEEDWAAACVGVDVVYDSIGSTLAKSLAAVRVGGQVVFYGMAGGDPEPVAPRVLMDGSKTLTGGDLWNVLTSAAERCRRAGLLFEEIAGGRLHVTISARFPLDAGSEAHRALESRKTTGKVLLIP
jgi:NADPH2:quinone reductase